MSQRIGMADGRCITSFDSNRIMNDAIMGMNNIQFQDNWSYRAFLQSKGPDAFSLPLANGACGSSGGCKVLMDE
jgi:hypothetical protein